MPGIGLSVGSLTVRAVRRATKRMQAARQSCRFYTDDLSSVQNAHDCSKNLIRYAANLTGLIVRTRHQSQCRSSSARKCHSRPYLTDGFVAAACDKCAYATVTPTILMPFNKQPTRFVLTRKCDVCYTKGTRTGVVTCTAVPLDSLMVSGALACRVVREQEWLDVCREEYESILLQRWMEADEEDEPASSMSELTARRLLIGSAYECHITPRIHGRSMFGIYGRVSLNNRICCIPARLRPAGCEARAQKAVLVQAYPEALGTCLGSGDLQLGLTRSLRITEHERIYSIVELEPTVDACLRCRALVA